jgi:hypothetical protein
MDQELLAKVASLDLTPLDAALLTQVVRHDDGASGESWESAFVESMAKYLEQKQELGGLEVGPCQTAEVQASITRLLERGLVRQVTSDVAMQMIAERSPEQPMDGVPIEEIVGQMMLTDQGADIWDQLFDGMSWIEEDSTRWFIRGTGAFSLWGCCTAMRDNPGSYRCCQLGCRVEAIGPWVIPYNRAVESGWRLICNRRADGN